jgi:23S rRNA pseudouridine1911/1915/1917 synthase
MPSGEARFITLSTRVPRRSAGRSLIAFLLERFPYQDEAQWRAAIERGDLTVEGKPATAERRLAPGEAVAYRKLHREPPAPSIVPILREDEALIAADKPAGLPVHADGAFVARTAIAILRAQVGAPLHTVHRLDRETSGVLLVAKTAVASRTLHEQFARGRVEKIYVGLVEGLVEASAFTIDAPIGRDPASSVAVRRAVVAATSPGAGAAATDVRVLVRAAGRTLVELRPRTGRTHQLRVHLASIGHPVVGDKLYGRSDADHLAWIAHVKAGGDPAFGGRFGAARHMLHASRLAVSHPATGTRTEVCAPWPQDLRDLLLAASAEHAELDGPVEELQQ